MPIEQYALLPNQRLIIKWTQSANTTINWPSQEAEFPSDFQSVGADFGGAFSLLGFAIPHSEVIPGEALAITLVWQVNTADIAMPSPTTADPLAAFVHVTSVDDPSDIVAQYDGWETALTGLETGDIIIHSIQLRLPEETPPASYQLNVGLYSPQSLQRLPVIWDGETADLVTLTQITVVAEDQ
jgi:hypothetical protein